MNAWTVRRLIYIILYLYDHILYNQNDIHHPYRWFLTPCNFCSFKRNRVNLWTNSRHRLFWILFCKILKLGWNLGCIQKTWRIFQVKELLHVFTYHNLSNTDSAEDRFIQKHGASETEHLFGLFTNKATNIGEKRNIMFRV